MRVKEPAHSPTQRVSGARAAQPMRSAQRKRRSGASEGQASAKRAALPPAVPWISTSSRSASSRRSRPRPHVMRAVRTPLPSGCGLAAVRFLGPADRLRQRSPRLSHAGSLRGPCHHHGPPATHHGACGRLLAEHGDRTLPSQLGERRPVGIGLGEHNARVLSDLACPVHHHPDDVRRDDLFGQQPRVIAHATQDDRPGPSRTRCAVFPVPAVPR